MKISSVCELQKIAKKIKQKINIGDSILLYGEIGVGKTTFTRLLINHISQTNRKIEVLSPTFNIVIEYFVNKINIRHFDLYRLKKVQDINNIGLFENINQSLTIIEWPEILEKENLSRYVSIKILETKKLNEYRDVEVAFFGDGWDDLVGALLGSKHFNK
mgnify:CR=1 FL=1